MFPRVSIRAAIAPLLQDAHASASQISQLLRGHPADILDRSGSWVQIRGADGYVGWCHEGYLDFENPAADQSAPGPLRGVWTDERWMSLGATVRKVADSSGESTAYGIVAERAVALPLGAMLASDEVAATGLAMNGRGRSRYFAPIPELLCQRATELFAGTPYQWGGVTPWGADCSGFIQTMFALHGTQLPRDAWQQAESGSVASQESDEWRPADLLFFSDREDGRVTHVAISLGGSTVVHCSLANGGYGINDVTGSDPVAQGLRNTFKFSKRIL